MLKIEKITEKVELLDVEVQSDPCKYLWDKSKHTVEGMHDCLTDCKGRTPKASVCY